MPVLILTIFKKPIIENITIMEKTTTEQKSLKKITTIDNITTIGKTTTKKITAKITTTALLFFLALFTLTTCDLVAQESGQARKQGWFVGVSPYFLGAEIRTTTENTTLTDTPLVNFQQSCTRRRQCLL